MVVLIPTVKSKFLARWQGPFEMIEKVDEVNYTTLPATLILTRVARRVSPITKTLRVVYLHGDTME